MADARAWFRHAWRPLYRGGAFFQMHLLSALRLGPRLPPGSLGPFSIARFGDDRFYARKLQRYGPIFKVWWNRNLTVCIVGFARARRLFAVHGQALLPLTIDIQSFVPYGFLRSMPREQHTRYRAMFVKALRGGLTEAWDADLRGLIRSELAGLAERDRSQRAPNTAALTPALDRIATRALLTLFFGLRARHPMFGELESGFRRMGPDEFVHPVGHEQRAGFDEIRVLAWKAVDALRADPTWADGEGVLGRLVSEGPTTVDETVVGNLIYMVEMGRYDVRSLFRWVLKYLSDSPSVIADLRAARASGQETLFEAVVLETLRLDQAEALNRDVTEEFTFDGYRIPRGASLRVLIRESHQDAETFSEPAAFKPCRFAGATYPSHAFAPFGIGDHRCVAASMVVRLATLLVEELVTGYTWSVEGDSSRFRGRYHWEPAPGFELVLQARGGQTS